MLNTMQLHRTNHEHSLILKLTNQSKEKECPVILTLTIGDLRSGHVDQSDLSYLKYEASK